MKKIQAMWATLLHAVRTRLSEIPPQLRRSMGILAWLIASLVGRWQWQAPAWLPWLEARRAAGSRYLAANPKRAALLALVVVLTAGGYVWYANRPRPHYVTYAVNSPGLTTYNDNGIASIKSMTIVFSESAAPLGAAAEGGDDRHRGLSRHRRHVVLDDRQGTSIHVEG